MRRKQSFFFIIIFLMLSQQFIVADNDCCGKVSSHTYFNVRPQFQIGSPEYLSVTRRLLDTEDDWAMNFNLTVFGGRSTNSDDIAKFFSPFCSPCINVNGTIEEQGKALLPQHFNLFSVKFSDELAMRSLPEGTDNISEAFASKLRLNPKQSTVGLGIAFAAKRKWRNYNWLFNISAPVIHVKNTMGLSESIVNAGEFYTVTPIEGETTNLNTDLKTMSAALKQDQWCFGKIDCDSHSTTRLAYIQATVGIEWVAKEDCHLSSALGVTIPTGNTPKAKYVFEPIAGHAKHAGILSHHAIDMLVWQTEENQYNINFAANIVMQYLFSRTEKRSMDLKNKPWSRYIELYKNKDQAIQANQLFRAGNILDSIFLASPGINFLTKDVKVKPGFNFTANMAMVIAKDINERGFNGEFGYNFYAQEAECVELKCCSLDDIAIKDIIGGGIVNPIRNITNDLLTNEAAACEILFNNKTNDDILADYETRKLTINDLDLNSAAHPCVLSHTVYGVLGYRWADYSRPITAGIGASYEFSGRMNASLDRWTIWGKAGIDF